MIADTKKPVASGRRQSSDTTLQLFQTNLEAMREWYAKQPGAGRELGHYTIMEMACGHSSVALQYALDGKEWKPA